MGTFHRFVQIIWRSFVRGAYKTAGLDSPYRAEGYGSNWSKQRKRCLERDNWTCQVCGTHVDEMEQEPSVHHIRPRKAYDNNWKQNELENLITLCSQCHGRFEGEFRESTPEEFAAKARERL